MMGGGAGDSVHSKPAQLQQQQLDKTPPPAAVPILNTSAAEAPTRQPAQQKKQNGTPPRIDNKSPRKEVKESVKERPVKMRTIPEEKTAEGTKKSKKENDGEDAFCPGGIDEEKEADNSEWTHRKFRILHTKSLPFSVIANSGSALNSLAEKSSLAYISDVEKLKRKLDLQKV